MSNKECFLQEIKNAIANQQIALSSEATTYLQALSNRSDRFSDQDIAILTFMSLNKEKNNNIFKFKNIAEALLSESMQRLVREGFCNKEGKNPIRYSITKRGEKVIDNINVDKH